MSVCYLLNFSSPRRVTQLFLTSLILIFSSELGILKKNKFPEKILRGKFLLETINSLYHILLYKNLDFVLWTIILTRGFFFVRIFLWDYTGILWRPIFSWMRLNICYIWSSLQATPASLRWSQFYASILSYSDICKGSVQCFLCSHFGSLYVLKIDVCQLVHLSSVSHMGKCQRWI